MEGGQDGEHLGGHLLCHGAPAQELSVPRSHVEIHTHTSNVPCLYLESQNGWLFK